MFPEKCFISVALVGLLARLHLVSLARSSKAKAAWKVHMDMHYVKPCPAPAIVSCSKMDFLMSREGEVMYNATCAVSKYVKEITEVSFKLTRCRDAVSSNTCEYFKTFQWSVGICELLKAKTLPLGQIWSKWSPSMYCPVQAGNYTMTDVKINIQDAGKIMDLPGYVWIGTSVMKARDEVFDCKMFEFKASKTRA